MGSAFLAFGDFFFLGEGFGEKEIKVPHLDGRTLHLGEGKCHLGTGSFEDWYCLVNYLKYIISLFIEYKVYTLENTCLGSHLL